MGVGPCSLWFSSRVSRLPHLPRWVGACLPSPGTPEHQGERPDGASLWKGCRLLLRKIAFVLQLLLLLVWPWVSAVNEILREVWRKLNTFLGSEARNLESSGQKPVHFYFGSQLLLDLLHVVPSQSRLPAISGVLMFPVLFWGFTLPWIRVSQADGADWGKLGRGQEWLLVCLQQPREAWFGQSRRDSKEQGNSLAELVIQPAMGIQDKVAGGPSREANPTRRS